MTVMDRYAHQTAHDERSVELYREIERLDWDEGNDFLLLKSGGDGDNGEHLMYLLDRCFELRDHKERQ